MQTVSKEILSLDSLEKLLLRSGLRLGDEVIIRIKPQGLEITTNPARALWGSLRSNKDASQLKLEAYEEMGDLLNAKLIWMSSSKEESTLRRISSCSLL